MALIKKWSLGPLGDGPITINGVTYIQGIDDDGKPGVQGYVPADYVEWQTDNRPLIDLTDNDEKLNTHVELNSLQIGNGVFEELGEKFLVSIVDNEMSRDDLYNLFLFTEDRFKVINMQLPKGYRYYWANIEDYLTADLAVVVGDYDETDTAKWYWKEWVDGTIIEDEFTEVDSSSVITNSGDRALVKEVLQNRARLADITPLHADTGVAFINGNYSSVETAKAIYDESSYSVISSKTHYNTTSGADTLLKDIEDEIKEAYPEDGTVKVTFVITEFDPTGIDPHDEYDFYVTIASSTTIYHGQYTPLMLAAIAWANKPELDALYAMTFDIGELLIPHPAQKYDVTRENLPFREYDPRYKTATSGYAYPQSADPDVIIRQGGRNFDCNDRGILPVSNTRIFREFEGKEAELDVSGAIGTVATPDIPIKDQSTQVELSYEFTQHIIQGEGRWDDLYNTWISGYEPDPYAIKDVAAIAEFDSAIYFAYHHKLYRLVKNASASTGDSLDTISTSIDEGEMTFGHTADANANRVEGNDADDFDATETITALATYDGWLYIGTSNGYLYRFQSGGTGATNTIEQVTAAGIPAALQAVNTLYVWTVPDQLAVGTDLGFRLLEHDGADAPQNVTITDLGTESPTLATTSVTAFTETSKYGSGYVQVLIIGTENNGIYYYGDRDFNSTRQLHHDDNYTNFVLNGLGAIQYASDFSSNYCTIKAFVKHKTQQDATIYMLVGIGDSSVEWDDDFGNHKPGDDELWRLVDANNEGDHEHFAYQRLNLYESETWRIDNFLENADFENGNPPDDWTFTGGIPGSVILDRRYGGNFNVYQAGLVNIDANTARVSQTYSPSGGLGVTPGTPKTFTFSIYMQNLTDLAASLEIGIEGLDNTGLVILESNSTAVNITTKDVWTRYTVTDTFSNVATVKARVYIKSTAAVQIGIDAAKLEESATATAFNSGGVNTSSFTSDNHACFINDIVSYSDHILMGGLRDTRGEWGGHKDEVGYSYPTGAPADEEYPNRPDGGINSAIDTVDGSTTDTLGSAVVEYLSSNGGLYYVDQLMLYNTSYGLDFFTFFKDANGAIWGGSKGRLFKVHDEKEASASSYVELFNDTNNPTEFRTIIRIPASDNDVDLIDPTSPLWHTFVISTLLQEGNKDRMRLIKGSVIVRNSPSSRVSYVEGRDYEVEYDPTNSNYGKIRRKPNPLFEMTGYGRIDPDQKVYIEYKYFNILEEVVGSTEGYKNLDLTARTVTINLPSGVLAENYELFCDMVYTKEFKGIDEAHPDFSTPVTGIKENLKPYDYVTTFTSAHVWSEKLHLLVYSRDQFKHQIYASYDFSIPRVDIIQLNEEWDEEGFVTAITPGIPHDNSPQEPNTSTFDEQTMQDAIAGGGGSITRQHVWYGFVSTDEAIKLYTMNVSQQDYFLNDIYDRRYYITKLQLWDYYIGIKSDTVAYFPFSRSFVSSNGRYIPATTVSSSTIEEIDDDNVCQFNNFPGEFDEQGLYDSEAEFQADWDYTPDYFGLSIVDEYGVRRWRADGLPDNPGIPRGLYITDPRSTGIAFDNTNAMQLNRNMTISQSFLDGSGEPLYPKDIYQFDLSYYLENAYGAGASSKLEVRIYYSDEGATGDLYYSTIRAFSGGADDLIEDKLDTISVRTAAAVIPKRIEIITSGWDESDEFGGGDPRYVGATHFDAGDYRAKLNLYLSNPRVYRAGVDYTKFYQSSARFDERIQYNVPLSGLAGSVYLKYKPTFKYNFNLAGSYQDSVVLFDSRKTANQENYFQIIYDAKDYNTSESLSKATFDNLGTVANPYSRWPLDGGSYWNSFKIVFYTKQMNIDQSDIEYEYRSYALDTWDTENQSRYKFESNEAFQVFHTLLVTWQRLDEIYPDITRFSDGYNDWQFLMTFYFDNLTPISKLIIIDPNVLENLTESIQIGGGWLKQSYNPSTETITWSESLAEGFINELRVERSAIDHDKAQLWINKKLPFLDANNIPVLQDIITLTDEVKIINGTTGEYANLRLNDMFIEGDLYVMGNEVIANVTTAIVEDNMIEVNRIQEFDDDGNWVGIPELASPVRSGIKSFRHPDDEDYDSALIWEETADEWQLIELDKFDITYDDNVLLGASWSTLSGTGTGEDNSIYTIVTTSDNTPTPMFGNSAGTWTFSTQIKTTDSGSWYVKIHTVAQLQDLSEIEHISDPFLVTPIYSEQMYRVVYETDNIKQVTIYLEVSTAGRLSSSLSHQNDVFAKTTTDSTNYEMPNETQDLRLRKLIVAAPIDNAGKEAFITYQGAKSAIKIMAVDGLWINNNVMTDSMTLKSEEDENLNVELHIYNNAGADGNLSLNAIRPAYIENIVNNSEITTFSGKVDNIQKYNLQISKSGHIEPGADADEVIFSTDNDIYQIMKIDSDANVYFRQAQLTNRDEPSAANPLIYNVIESVKLDLNDTLGTQDCVRVTLDQSGTGAVEAAPLVSSEIALSNSNESNGVRYLQAYKITFSGRVSGAPGDTQANIQHNLNISLDKTVVMFGVSSPLRHVYWDPTLSNANNLVVKLDDENTMTTTESSNPNDWVDPDDGYIKVFVTIMGQVPVTSGITMS